MLGHERQEAEHIRMICFDRILSGTIQGPLVVQPRRKGGAEGGGKQGLGQPAPHGAFKDTGEKGQKISALLGGELMRVFGPHQKHARQTT